MSFIAPMLAKADENVPMVSNEWVYECKYDGIRIEAEAKDGNVRLSSRAGNDKTKQFPEVVAAIKKAGLSGIFDGEIVAMAENGDFGTFQDLQGRIHLDSGRSRQRVTYVLFDILRDRDENVQSLPWHERRDRLERRVSPNEALALSTYQLFDARPLYQKAKAAGWEGLIAKKINSPYLPGKRIACWTKMKFLRRQEFVVAGYTVPRGTRSCFGALQLGVYREDGALVYAGSVGTGFTESDLAFVMGRMKKLASKTCPLLTIPQTDEEAKWLKPKLVAEVKFHEWTKDGKLRFPVFFGLRDDVNPKTVKREGEIHAFRTL